MPKELSDVQGNLVWSAQYKAWGNTLKIEYPELEAKAELEVKKHIPHTESDWPTQRENCSKTLIQQWQNDFNQALLFQGQYFDEETGLHYNRFRYYDPDVGRFTTQDPIGLLGGDNLYQYAPNPMGWVDPLGLASLSEIALREAAKLRAKGIGLDSATKVSVVRDKVTGAVFTGVSGNPSQKINKDLEQYIPNKSREKWKATNCAEVDALNKAFKARNGAKMSDMIIVTISVRNNKNAKPCKNCKITTNKASVQNCGS